jgi:HEAT repeat protein
MSNPQDPSNPILTVLNTLKSRMAPEKEIRHKWKDDPGELTAEHYPALSLPVGKHKAGPRAASEEESPEARLQSLVRGGQLRKLEGSQIGPVFQEMLNGGFLECFVLAIDQMHAALESSAPDDRRWGLDSVRALLAMKDLDLVPYGTLPLLLDCLGHVLVKEERVELLDSALASTATLLGIEAAKGEMESVHAHLAWLERAVRGRGADYLTRIMTSRELITPSLERLFQDGHAIMESRILPFFRFVGEAGARTLMVLLDEEQNRQHRHRILELLKLLGPLSIPALQEGLVAGSWRQVRNALNLVGELEETQAFEYVVPCLDHADARVVHPAIRALWKTGGSRAERYLLDLLPRSNAETQTEILQGLGRIGTSAAISAIGKLVAGANEDLRIKAMDALGKLKHPEAIPILEIPLKRKGWIFKTSELLPVRLAAARALMSIGTQEALRKAGASLNDWG